MQVCAAGCSLHCNEGCDQALVGRAERDCGFLTICSGVCRLPVRKATSVALRALATFTPE